MKKSCKLLVAMLAVFIMLLIMGCDQLMSPGGGTDEAFTVTFVTNCEATIDPVEVDSGEVVEKPTDPVKNDYTLDRNNPENAIVTQYVFIGWYKDEALSERFDFSTKITGNQTLYAKWRPIAKSGLNITPDGGSATNYDNTEEMYVIDPRKMDDDFVTILGYTPGFLDESADDMEKGVFWNGQTVKLSPYIMSRYEVTQELYTAVMTGNTFTCGTGSNEITIKNNDGTTATNGTTGSINISPSVCYYDTTDSAAVAATNYLLAEDESIEKRPVENVTWFDAVYFCNRLTAKVGGGLTAAYTITDIVLTLDPPPSGGGSATSGHITSANVVINENGTGYRLPTEAEWEFAARGGNTEMNTWDYMFSGSDTANGKTYDAEVNSGLDKIGWYAFNTGTSDGNTSANIPTGTNRVSWGSHETGTKAYNELGLYDMSGNVAEWCWDVPAYSTLINPKGATVGNDSQRVVRGGSWYSFASECVVSHRDVESPSTKAADIGFRVVRSIAAN